MKSVYQTALEMLYAARASKSPSPPRSLHAVLYEPATVVAILMHLPPDGVYVDVGANVGALALAVAALRPASCVVCVEADPDISAMLRRNVVENQRLNITVVEFAAGATSTSVSFYRAPACKFGMGSIGPQFSGAPIAVAQRPLDELGIARIDVIKLDIEGAELGALRGFARHLSGAHPPTVIFEFADWAEGRVTGQVPGDAQRLLISHGYRLFQLDESDASALPLDRPITKGAAMILAMSSRSP